ncbi:PHD and RING finger domain-containing protein 1-like [Argopecten irradians]|uniref:PHD and RING finger domain-containing protein 1-like n=1 Tax=Argopecten irradians TaxID=31199 RepID=UPI003719CB77
MDQETTSSDPTLEDPQQPSTMDNEQSDDLPGAPTTAGSDGEQAEGTPSRKRKAAAIVESDEDEDDEEGSDEEDDESDEEEDGSEDDCEGNDDEDENEEEVGEDWETDEEEEDDDDEESQEASTLLESESDGEGENCPVCLNRFRDQDIGTPESCDHNFCLECIQEWSNNVNTCPVDRQVFHLIFAKHAGEDKVFRRIVVEDKNMCDIPEEEDEDPTYCEVCGRCDREDRLLLCDGCDQGFHCECLTPPLQEIPVEEWFCPECADLNRQGSETAETVDDSEEVSYIIRENAASSATSFLRPRRQVPRTRVMERVRSQIAELRRERARRFARIEIIADSTDEEDLVMAAEEMETEASSGAGPSKPAAAKKRKAPAKRKSTPAKKTRKTTTKTKKKSTTKRKRKSTTKKGKGKKGVKKRRKKKTKTTKKARTAKTVKMEIPSSTVKARIARNLGLSSPPVGRTIPLQKASGEKTTELKKHDSGIAPLSILGHKDDLYSFQDEDAPQAQTSVVAQGKTSRYSRSSLQSHKPVGKPRASSSTSSTAAALPVPTPGPSTGGFDLLGSIMQNQTLLGMDSKNVTIQRDGTLLAKPEKKKTPAKEPAKPESTTPKKESDEELCQDDEAYFSPEYDEEEKVAKLVEEDEVKEETVMVAVEENLDTSTEKEKDSDNIVNAISDNEAADSENEINVKSDNDDENEIEESDNEHETVSNESQANDNEKSDDENKTAYNEADEIEENNEVEKTDSDHNEGENLLPKETHEDAEMNTEETIHCDKSRSSSPLDSVRYLDREVNTSVNPDKEKSPCPDEESTTQKSIEGEVEGDAENVSEEEVDEENQEEEEEDEEGGEEQEDEEAEEELEEVDEDGDKDDEDDEVQVIEEDAAEKVEAEVSDKKEDKDEIQNEKDSINSMEEERRKLTELIAQDELGDAWDTDGDDRGATWSEDNMDNEESETRNKPKHSGKSRKSRKGDSRVVVEENSQDSALMEEALLPISEFPRIPKKKRRSRSSRSEPDAEKSSANKSKQSEEEEESFKRTVMKEEDVIIVKVETAKRLHEFKTEKKDTRDMPESSSSRRERGDDRKDRDRDSKRSHDRDRDRERDRDRDRDGSSRHKHRRDRYRSRSRSRERRDRDRSRSRDRSRRSRSRDRKRYERSRSRSWERHHKKRRRDKSREREKGSRRSKSPGRRTQEKENRLSGDEKRHKRREEKFERKEEISLWTKKSQSKSDENVRDSAIPEDMLKRLKIPPLMSQKITVVTNKKPDIKETQPISVITSEKSQNIEVIGRQPTDSNESPTEVIDTNNDNTKVPENKESAINISAIQIPPIASNNITLNPPPVECAGEYDPAFPTDDPEESSPPLPPLDAEPMVYNVPPPQMSFPPHMIEESFNSHQRLSPLPPHQPPPPSQGILGEGGTILLPTSDPSQPLLQQSQNVPPMPLGLRMLPQGYQHGMPPQRPMMLNPMLINRAPLSRFPRFQAGHLPQFSLQVPTSGNIMSLQNRFGPRMVPGSLPGQPNLVNGGFEPIPPESGPPHQFQHMLRGPSDPNLSHDPRMQGPPGGPPPRHLSLQESNIPTMLPDLGLRERMPSVSIPGGPGDPRHREGPPQSLQGLSQLEQITHISKLINVHAQLAMMGKESDSGESGGQDCNGDDVFKVPLPPLGGSKQKLVLGGAMNSNGKEEVETMEVVDMDMSSPLDDGNIELHLTQDKNSDKVFGSLGSDSSSKSSDRRSKRDKRGSDSHSGKVRFKGARDSDERTSKSSRVKVKEKRPKPQDDDLEDPIFDDIMNDMSNDEMPSSAVELTNKEKYLKKLHLQERVVDEVKVALKPFYNTKQVNKEQYKEILRKAVPKVCHSKSGDINPVKIKVLVEAYVSKYKRDNPSKSKVKRSKDSSVKANGEVKTKTKSSR